jgi:hypothetical protein
MISKMRKVQQEDKILTHNFIMRKVQHGKEHARTAKKLYEEYTNEGGVLSYEVFYRKIRNLIESERRKRVRIIGDDEGFYIAASEEEWNKYELRAKNRILSELKTLALCNGLSVLGLLKGWFDIRNHKQIESNQPTFFDCSEETA